MAFLERKEAASGDILLYSGRDSVLKDGIVVECGRCRCGAQYEVLQRGTCMYEDLSYVVPIGLFRVRLPSHARLASSYSNMVEEDAGVVPLYSAMEMAAAEHTRPLIRRVK